MKKPKQLEKLVRGFSNHRRIEMLDLLDDFPDLSVIEISDKLRINYKTGAEHIRRLSITGLVTKRNDDIFVRHSLSDEGTNVLKFLRTLE